MYTILVVEDEKQIQKGICNFLEREAVLKLIRAESDIPIIIDSALCDELIQIDAFKL